MEADWEFEIGGDAPIIEAQWPGFVDLREHPHLAGKLTEARRLPGLAGALTRLNATDSPVWTSKTDVFDPGPLDADELDATHDEVEHTVSCYIDLLMRSNQQWNFPVEAERSCRGLCKRLGEIPLRCCRIDLVIRRAYVLPDLNDLGMTAYFTACGRSGGHARARLGECLSAFATAIVTEPE